MTLIIDVKVVPRSGKSGCKLEGEQLKCYLKSPPEKGKANAELIKFFARSLGISVQSVVIIAGQTARLKRIRIEAPITFDTLCGKLGIDRQQTLF